MLLNIYRNNISKVILVLSGFCSSLCYSEQKLESKTETPGEVEIRKDTGAFCRGAVETNPTGNHGVVGSTPGLAQWVEDSALQ